MVGREDDKRFLGQSDLAKRIKDRANAFVSLCYDRGENAPLLLQRRKLLEQAILWIMRRVCLAKAIR